MSRDNRSKKKCVGAKTNVDFTNKNLPKQKKTGAKKTDEAVRTTKATIAHNKNYKTKSMSENEEH